MVVKQFVTELFLCVRIVKNMMKQQHNSKVILTASICLFTFRIC